MKPIKISLYKQLLLIIFIIIVVVFIPLMVILPKQLLPIYEENMYQNLKQSLIVSRNDITTADKTQVAYIYVYNTAIYVSTNITDIIPLEASKIILQLKNEYGKFTYGNKTYYYNTYHDVNYYKVALASNNYVMKIRKDVLTVLMPILVIITLIVITLIYLWNRLLINKIEHLKAKIDNLDNDTYDDTYKYLTNDEFQILAKAIDDMKLTLKEQEEYKNQMYQNISHDFKTPISVIKSYVEGIEDNVTAPEEGISIIKEEVSKLENKVNSLLYLNKLNYLKERNYQRNEKIDIQEVIKDVIKKFQLQRPEIKWEITYADKYTKFNGNYELWETILDNLLNNFMRYAVSEIKITVKNKKIQLFNDGENIDENIVNNIFNPYTKGIKGQFGLGLSIVKKSLSFINYEVNVKNEKKGVTFTIK